MKRKHDNDPNSSAIKLYKTLANSKIDLFPQELESTIEDLKKKSHLVASMTINYFFQGENIFHLLIKKRSILTLKYFLDLKVEEKYVIIQLTILTDFHPVF